MSSENLSSPDVHLSKEERMLNIILKLFETTQPLSSNLLADITNVSRRTIVNDLKVIEAWLNKNNLNLEYIKNKGFLIVGDEEDYRNAYADRINEYFETMSPYTSMKLFSNSELTMVRRVVIETLSQVKYNLVQSAVDGLIYHLLIAIHRLKGNFSFEIPLKEKYKLSSTFQYQIALILKENLEKN